MSHPREIAERICRWALPYGLYQVLEDRYSKDGAWRRKQPELDPETAERNRALRDRHKGERGFILACGPSIQSQDLRPLSGETTISVASFFIHRDFGRIRPAYHCVAPFHPPFTQEEILSWYRNMAPHMEGTKVFLGYNDRTMIEESRIFEGRDVHYLQFGDDWVRRKNRNFDISRKLPDGQSVSLIALSLAIHLGFSEIYLLGVDHTQFNTSTGARDYKHFYDNHDSKALRLEPPPEDLESTFENYARLWKQYKAIRDYAGEQGTRIYNATRGGLLDIFPRVEYEQVVDVRAAANL